MSRNALCFLAVLAFFCALYAFVVAPLWPTYPRWYFVLLGILLGNAGYVVYQSFHQIPRGRRIAAFFLGSFEAQYVNADDYRIMEDWYRTIKTDDPGFRRFCRRGPFDTVGFGDWVYLQFPFFSRYGHGDKQDVVSDRLRIEITAVDSVWTKEEKHTPSVQLLVDIEVGMRIGPDFGKLLAAFTDVNFSEPKETQNGLKHQLEPVLKDAVRRVGREFVWVPPGSNGDTTHDLRTHAVKFEERVREELRRDPESVFVQAGLITHFPRANIPDATSPDGGPGAIGLDISIENVKPSNKKLEEAADEASIAASKAAAKVREKKGLADGLKEFSQTLGVETSVAIGHDMLTNAPGTIFFGGKNITAAAAALLAARQKKPNQPPTTPPT